MKSAICNQQCNDNANFYIEFSPRLADIAKQNWKSDIDANAKLSVYREIKSLLEPEKYLKEIDNYFGIRTTSPRTKPPWTKSPLGDKIPLDKIPPVYFIFI